MVIVRFVFGYLFDAWTAAKTAFHIMVDDALNVWDFGDDEEDQW